MVGGQRHASAAFAPGMKRYPLYRRLGGTQGRSERVGKIYPKPGFDSRTAQTEASRYKEIIIAVRWSYNGGAKLQNVQRE